MSVDGPPSSFKQNRCRQNTVIILWAHVRVSQHFGYKISLLSSIKSEEMTICFSKITCYLKYA